MARRGMTGQLNMFEFFRELETNSPQNGELEMVSLMPSFEEDEEPVSSVKSEPVTDVTEAVEEIKVQEIKEQKGKAQEIKEQEIKEQEIKAQKIENTTKSTVKNEVEKPVMRRTYTTKQGVVEIAYMNYGKVRVSGAGLETEIKEFATSKEAVDYYVELMQGMEELYAEDME